MRRSILRNASLFSCHFLRHTPSSAWPSTVRFFSESDSNPPLPPQSGGNPLSGPPETSVAQVSASPDVPDVSTKDLTDMINKYLKGEEEVLPSIMESILRRRMSGKHEDTDDELMEKLRLTPLEDVNDKEFDSDFDEAYETDQEIENLYDARSIVINRMRKDEYFNMDDKKWDEMIKEATEKGYLKDLGECERILEDMLHWDKLLPDEIKKKVEAKFNELGDMCERGEIEPERAYELFKEYEDQMVLQCAEMMKAEQPPEDDDSSSPAVIDKKKELDDPPGEGPILRWTTRVVFAPGGDAWHPTNRKVKLAVTVKELELSKHAFRRLREVVGKRYHPGRDELTITSERFEHREENRKDCLRTLYALIEDAMKADKLVQETRVSYVKDRLRANPAFMDRLQAKTARMQGPL
ncbi:uncharacterized protein [Aristolochia californica]|uniref:uncharacterized protein n=1 Tax=Aristolochia californica TaxID=171875 RepID=UPI0035E0E06E